MGATLTVDPNAQTTAALEARIGPDMRQLWRQFPPRPAVPSWPTTDQDREGLLARLLDAPFAGADAAGGSRASYWAVPAAGLVVLPPRPDVAAPVGGQRRRRQRQRRLVAADAGPATSAEPAGRGVVGE